MGKLYNLSLHFVTKISLNFNFLSVKSPLSAIAGFRIKNNEIIFFSSFYFSLPYIFLLFL